MNTYLSPKTPLKSTTGTAGKPEQKTTMKRRTMRTTEEKMPFNMHCSFSFFFKDNRTQTHDKQLLSINGRYISQSTEWEWKKMSFDYMIMAISGLELTPYSFAHFNNSLNNFCVRTSSYIKDVPYPLCQHEEVFSISVKIT